MHRYLRKKTEKTKQYTFSSKVTGLLLALVALCLVTPVVIAWSDYANHKTNEFTSVPLFVRVVLNKYEKDIEGAPTGGMVPGAEFWLFEQLEDFADPESDTRIGTSYFTDKNGQIVVHDLPPGKSYYFWEANPSYGYDYDLDDTNAPIRVYPFEVVGNETEQIVVDAYNRCGYDALTIAKTVQNGDGSELTEEQRQQVFAFTVTFSVEGAFPYTIDGASQGIISSGDIIYLRHGQRAMVHELPIGTNYLVAEAPVAGYATSCENAHATLPEGGIVADFLNIFYPGAGSLIVTKEVQGDEADPENLFTFEVEFSDGGRYPYYVNTEYVAHTEAGRATIQLRHEDTLLFAGLPEGIGYTVREIDANTGGYLSLSESYTGTVIAGEITLPFVNYNDSAPGDSGSLAFNKLVSGVGGDLSKEFAFTVTFSDGGSYGYRIDDGELVIHTSGEKISIISGQQVVFENVPTGTGYTITEDDYLGDYYYASIIETNGVIIPGGPHGSILFENRYVDPVLILRKIVAGEISDSDVGREFWFTVIVNGEVQRVSIQDGQEIRIPIPPNAVFTVEEDNYVPDGFVLTSERKEPVLVEGIWIYEIIFTNTYTGPVFIDINGQKSWDISADPTVQLPESITVYVKDGETIVDTQVVTAANGWRYTFTLPKYRSDGQTLIEYTIDEVDIPSFIKNVQETNIINTYLKPAVSAPVMVEKRITGSTPSVDSVFTFMLQSQNGAPMPAESAGDSKQISISGAGQTNFGTITFTQPGSYTYIIREVRGSEIGYSYDNSVYTLTVVVEQQENALVVTSYTYAKPGATAGGSAALFINNYDNTGDEGDPDKRVTVSGLKSWNHGTNPEAERPDFVTLHILANGRKSLSFTVDASTHWTYSFNLPKYDKNGNEIVYTVDESDVEGYSKTINGFDITNTHRTYTGGGNTGDGGGGGSGTAQTGDTTSLLFWMLLMGASAMCMCILLGLYWHRQRQRKNNLFF